MKKITFCHAAFGNCHIISRCFLIITLRGLSRINFKNIFCVSYRLIITIMLQGHPGSPRGHSEVILVADPRACGYAYKTYLGVSPHLHLDKRPFFSGKKQGITTVDKYHGSRKCHVFFLRHGSWRFLFAMSSPSVFCFHPFSDPGTRMATQTHATAEVHLFLASGSSLEELHFPPKNCFFLRKMESATRATKPLLRYIFLRKTLCSAK